MVLIRRVSPLSVGRVATDMSGETSHQEYIGPYKLLSRLGGGIGAVHRAAGPDGRDVAIRLLPPGAVPDVARMRDVLSPYVVDVLDGEPAGPSPYVVSRFVPGRPLAEHVAEQGPMGGAVLRRMALGLAKRSEEHTSELQSRFEFVCRLLLEKKKSLTIRNPQS